MDINLMESINQSYIPVKQSTCNSQSWWWYYFCPTDAMCSQRLWYSAQALLIFTVLFLHRCPWSLLLGIFVIQNCNKNKPILQPKKRKNRKKMIYFDQGLQVIPKKGVWGGGGSPWEGEKITAICAWLYIRPFLGPDQPIGSQVM